MGLVPARAATAASEQNRPACDQLTSTWAALRGPTPGTSSSQGDDRTDQLGQLGLELVSLDLEKLDALGSGPQCPHGGVVLQRPGVPPAQRGAVLDLVGGATAAQFGA